jgi:hypothetical protein
MKRAIFENQSHEPLRTRHISLMHESPEFAPGIREDGRGDPAG